MEHQVTGTFLYNGRKFKIDRARSCPRRLVRRHCRRGECWCLSHLNDHGATWTVADRSDEPLRQVANRMVVWEPYQANGEDLAEVIAAAERDGLMVMVSTDSAYLPGSTLAIQFEPEWRPWRAAQ